MTQIPDELSRLLERYAAAWNAHDLDAILADHTPECVFHLHAGGPEVSGLAAVRAAFAASFAQWPDIHFSAQDVRVGADHVTVRWTVTATAGGRRVRFDALDVIVLEAGRIARKDSYVDAIAIQQQLAA